MFLIEEGRFAANCLVWKILEVREDLGEDQRRTICICFTRSQAERLLEKLNDGKQPQVSRRIFT